MPSRTLSRPCLLVVAAFLTAAGGLRAQQADHWTVSGELGASFFFGNTRQITLASQLSAALADSAREFSGEAAFAYGEASDAAGATFVNKRSWELGLTYDHHPLERWSPFLLAKVESSWEKRIELRYNAGVGAKYTLDRRPDRRVDLSAAVVAERTRPTDLAPDSDVKVLARWSVRFRAKRSLLDDGRFTLSEETWYRPQVDVPSEFTLTSTTGLSYQLNDVIALKLTFADAYDSQAVARGARTNNDGQLLFSVLSSF